MFSTLIARIMRIIWHAKMPDVQGIWHFVLNLDFAILLAGRRCGSAGAISRGFFFAYLEQFIGTEMCVVNCKGPLFVVCLASKFHVGRAQCTKEIISGSR